MATLTWERLPSINIAQILSNLSLTDRLNAASCCKRWRGCLFHPSLWSSINLKVNHGHRRGAKHLADMCGRFVRSAVVEFNSTIPANVRECLRILNIFGVNVNLEKLALKPSSCQVQWSEGKHDKRDLFLDAVEKVAQNARHLKHLSLGCIAELTDHCEDLLPMLADHQAYTLHTLHIASVKENPDSYGLIDFPAHIFNSFRHLQTLSLDYDYVSNTLLLDFSQVNRVKLQKLIIHVHGIEPGHEKIRNDTWCQLVKTSPQLEVTLNLIHSLDGSTGLIDLLQPAMPLAHLRMFFCQYISVAAINFIGQHMRKHLKSVHIVDGLTNHGPNVYQDAFDEDPFVMLVWKCHVLSDFKFIGYSIVDDDVVAMARLRGSQLKLDIPLCCIATIEEEDDDHNAWVTHGVVGSEFNTEVSRSLCQDWQPIPYHKLHPAVRDSHADAETAYLPILLNDQG